MKKFKTFITMLAAIAAMILLPGVFSLKASAAEHATYHVKYDPDLGGWYVLTAAEAEENSTASPKSMQFFYNNVRCGDAVVVSCYYDNAPQLDLGSTRLRNVTILPDGCFVMIKSAGIADLFVLANNTCSISAPVINAYVYDPSVVNFNSNVKDILLNVDATSSSSSMAGLGTVESLKVHFTYNNTSYTLYDFKKGTFYFAEGTLQTTVYNFSTVPSASPFQIPVTAQSSITTLKDLFDEHYYADTYADLKAVYGYNREALWMHYITCGIKEGRNMNPLLNVTNYRLRYLDLNAAFGDNWDAYVTHYLTLGVKEGRDSGTEFNAAEYANWYDDLTKTYGNNIQALWQHYKAIGVEWSRQP